jgi:hypothetical protein
MKHPLFHPEEEAIIGPYPADGSLIGRVCKIIEQLDPIYGEHRYLVEMLDDYTRARVLEVTLIKKWQRCDWGMLRGIWQPKRVTK